MKYPPSFALWLEMSNSSPLASKNGWDWIFLPFLTALKYDFSQLDDSGTCCIVFDLKEMWAK